MFYVCLLVCMFYVCDIGFIFFECLLFMCCILCVLLHCLICLYWFLHCIKFCLYMWLFMFCILFVCLCVRLLHCCICLCWLLCFCICCVFLVYCCICFDVVVYVLHFVRLCVLLYFCICLCWLFLSLSHSLFSFHVSCLHFAQLSPVRYVSSANLSPGLYTLCQDVNPRECVRVSVVSFHFCLSIFPASCLHFIYTPFSYEGVCVLWQCFPSVVSGCKTPACVWELVCFPSIFVCQSFACPVCIFHSSLLSGMCPPRICPQVCTHCVRM